MLPQVNEISYSETDVNEGLLNLLNKGKIPRGSNIDIMFQGKDSMISKPAK